MSRAYSGQRFKSRGPFCFSIVGKGRFLTQMLFRRLKLQYPVLTEIRLKYNLNQDETKHLVFRIG